MAPEELKELLEKNDYNPMHEGNHIGPGIKIINKYLPKVGITAANDNQVWFCNAEELCNAGLIKEDALILAEHNFMIDKDAISLFVDSFKN